TEFSEPSGYFRSDNFISNEETFQYVIPELQKRVPHGSVYLGVGPDQNFTYIAALQPRMAFVVDIRRQNMLEHLLFKAVFEQAADRLEFLSRLFSRPIPADLPHDASLQAMFDAFDAAATDEKVFETNQRTVVDLLRRKHGFKLSDDDVSSLKYVYRAFY